MAIACKQKTQTGRRPISHAATPCQHRILYRCRLLQGDIRNVESYAAGILRKATIKGKKDSAFIQLPDFQRIAKQFLLKELDSALFQEPFQETSFMDQTTQMLNFIYTQKNTDSPLQKVMVYVKPSEQPIK